MVATVPEGPFAAEVEGFGDRGWVLAGGPGGGWRVQGVRLG